MADIIISDKVLKEFPEPRPAIQNDLMLTVNGLLDEKGDSKILNMHPLTRRLWLQILEQMEQDNPQDQAPIQRLRERIAGTL